jgi:2-polyprenyl-6-methoxyphenol hydroxylase-like FAD-dependent oxidoreductase
MLNDGPPTERDYVAWRGVLPHTLDSSTTGTATEIYGRGQRFGIGPLGGGKVGWWASANKSLLRGAERFDDATIHEHHALVHDNMEEIRAVLLRLFDGWCEPVLDLIRATPLTALVRNATLDRDPVRKWTDGCVTLLGDAIHPVTPNLGQGGCLAIEDAAVLARCFAKYVHNSESEAAITVALRKFEQLRFSRTAWIARSSRVYGNFGQWQNTWAAQLRGSVQRLVPTRLAASALRKVFDYDAFAVEV